MCVALLRAVNLAGQRMVSMSDLRALAAELGFADAKTLLQSGNLVFAAKTRATSRVEQMLERAARDRFSIDVEFFVRTADEWDELMAANPFRAEARDDPAHLLVMFLKNAVEARHVAALQDAITGREIVRARGRHAYIVYPDGVGRSKLTVAVIEKHLGTRATGRNWNTVVKLATLARV
jgi:uncharacterized protein (DUF1697 family)